jgi:hypothetical protein
MMRGGLTRVGEALRLGLVLLTLTTAPALAAGVPSGGPGPPPGAGSGIPLPPPSGQGPPAEPNGPASTIPTPASGPGLLSGFASVSGTSLRVPIACGAGGSAALSVAAISRGTLAQAQYRCSRGRSTVRFVLPKATATKIASRVDLLASLTFKQGATREQLSLALQESSAAAGSWTSVYGLNCSTAGRYAGQLVAPNFTDTPATTVDVRPWLAWYSSSTGWQWLGTQGPARSAWYRWTATPAGVAEWQTAGTISPWTWGPISVAPGHGTYVIAVLEAIYWYSHPTYVWRYARSVPSSGVVASYCAYP